MAKDDKAIMFFSAPASRYLKYFRAYNLNSVLMSYHYVKQKKGDFMRLIEFIEETNGYLMIDSGAFTFKNSTDPNLDYTKEETYKSYMDEFIQFCYDHSKWIYCTVNMDMERWVGFDVVDKWNDTLFKPLSKVTNVVFNIDPEPIDQMERLKLYCKQFDYIGLNRKMIDRVEQVYAYAQMNKVRVHGFAITSLSILKNTPLFSVDSTSWLSGSRFGSTYKYDGKNFYNFDANHKHRRKTLKLLCREYGIDYEGVINDDNDAITAYNLFAWIGFEKEYLKMANLKLRTDKVSKYDRR